MGSPRRHSTMTPPYQTPTLHEWQTVCEMYHQHKTTYSNNYFISTTIKRKLKSPRLSLGVEIFRPLLACRLAKLTNDTNIAGFHITTNWQLDQLNMHHTKTTEILHDFNFVVLALGEFKTWLICGSQSAYFPRFNMILIMLSEHRWNEFLAGVKPPMVEIAAIYGPTVVTTHFETACRNHIGGLLYLTYVKSLEQGGYAVCQINSSTHTDRTIQTTPPLLWRCLTLTVRRLTTKVIHSTRSRYWLQTPTLPAQHSVGCTGGSKRRESSRTSVPHDGRREQQHHPVNYRKHNNRQEHPYASG